MLLLHLTKSSYEELGLPAANSSYVKQGNSKRVVEIDIAKPSFHPGQPSFDRVKSRLEECHHLKATFLVSWVPHGMSWDHHHFTRYQIHSGDR